MDIVHNDQRKAQNYRDPYNPDQFNKKYWPA